MIFPLVLGLAFIATARTAPTKWIDMSYPFVENVTIYWPGNTLYQHRMVFEGHYPGTKIFITISDFIGGEHGGTHIDAPRHFNEAGITLEKIPIESMVGDAIVVNVSAKCDQDRDYQMSVDDLKEWEKTYGPIPAKSIVFMYTGFGRSYPDKKKYFGTNTPTNTSTFHFPGIDPVAAQWLVDNNKIKLFGIDTPSFDRGQSLTFGSHLILLKRNIPGIENVANLHLLPPKGAEVFAAPMKIKEGSGGPCRLYARIADKMVVSRGVDPGFHLTPGLVLMSITFLLINF
ncbi:uncharacterized protein LOC116302625 [Actinia tenebrosa]|uniref:Uncharacterized protein LOC116302625 n=1 Tax=Actinia tenebrosa TaxID=6105 RepID=A0A6P8IM05_ACTTE|nr:uncharacterized protein LOC116302625 [Actinia tenebrosa]